MKVWIVMEQYTTDDDGNWEIEFEAVHATEAGARADLQPDYARNGHTPGTRERYTFEAEVADP